jgi:hypothetical protein
LTIRVKKKVNMPTASNLTDAQINEVNFFNLNPSEAHRSSESLAKQLGLINVFPKDVDLTKTNEYRFGGPRDKIKDTFGYPNYYFKQKQIYQKDGGFTMQVDAFAHEFTTAAWAFHGGPIGPSFSKTVFADPHESAFFTPSQGGAQFDADNMDYFNNRLGLQRGLEAWRRNNDPDPANDITIQDLIDQVKLDVESGTAIVDPWKDWFDSQNARIAPEMWIKYSFKEQGGFISNPDYSINFYRPDGSSFLVPTPNWKGHKSQELIRTYTVSFGRMSIAAARCQNALYRLA